MDRLPLAEVLPNAPPRRLQQVSNLATRRSVIAWMIENVAIHGRAGLDVRVIQTFPKHFCGQRPANLVKTKR